MITSSNNIKNLHSTYIVIVMLNCDAILFKNFCIFEQDIRLSSYEVTVKAKKEQQQERKKKHSTSSLSTSTMGIKQSFSRMGRHDKKSKQWKQITDTVTVYLAKDMVPKNTVSLFFIHNIMKKVQFSEFTAPPQKDYDPDSHLSLVDISGNSRTEPSMIRIHIKQSTNHQAMFIC